MRGMSVSGDCGSGGTVALGSRLAVRFWLALPSAHAQPSVSIDAFCTRRASRAYVSVGVFCTRLTPGFPFLTLLCPRLTPSIAILVQLFALGTRPGLAFLLLHLPWFTPVFFLIEEKETACDMLRSYSAGSRSPSCVLAALARLSAFVGSLRV